MKWIKSRTILVLVLTAFIGAFQALEGYFEPDMYVVLNTILLALAAYFRVDARIK